MAERARWSVLVVDDDEDDRTFAREAFDEAGIPTDIRFADDGVELLDYLYRRGKFVSPESSPRPDLILLDLRMPRKSGHDALAEIKESPTFRPIPVVVLTTSDAEDDVIRSYELGANSYVVKPTTFSGLVDTLKHLCRYWLDVVTPREEA
jgi:CheY-like chemotaxis protein